MRSRALTLLVCSALLATTAKAQLQRIVLQGGGAPQVFTDLGAAVTAAQSGDKLYLSGGVFNYTGSLVVDKTLHFIGAGIGPDSSSVTNTTSISPTTAVQVFTAGSGSSFTGIRFLNTMQYGDGAANFSPTGIVFQRCEFISYAHLGAGSTTVIDECVFRFRFYGYDGQATVTRSIFSYGGTATHAPISAFTTGGLTMDHCTVLLGRITNSEDCTVANCIFTRTASEPLYQSSGAIVTNNLIAHGNIGGNMTPGATSGNVLGAVVADMFINETSGGFDWTDDLHLQPTSVGVGMATDGTDVGIYGTGSPYKPGAVPYNPHFRSADIAPATNPGGYLPVNIRVAAQTHRAMKHILTIVALMALGQLRAQTITDYRYWINDDLATLTTASIGPSADVTLINTLALPLLTKDFNIITLQFKDSNGEWGSPQTTPFTKSTGEVNGYEYWIDDAITSSYTGSIGPNTIVDLIADLPTGTTNGTHFFTIRFGSANGTWTVPLTTEFSFFNTVEELPGISDLMLFPNPVTDELGLRLSTEVARTLNLQVLDITGAVVRDLSNWSVSGTTYRNWDISDLASGSYLLRMSDGTGPWTTRFVKQ